MEENLSCITRRSSFGIAQWKNPLKLTNRAALWIFYPTLSNLFGVEYDSRLLMGRIFFQTAKVWSFSSDHSWLTEKGRYNASADEFIPLTEKKSMRPMRKT